MPMDSNVIGWLAAFFVQTAVALVTDVCINKAEDLDIECGNDEIIVANRAHFGRMELGRCLTTDYQIGCGTDVLFLVDRWCSGRKQCNVHIPNKDLIQSNICAQDLLMFLQVEYDCSKVHRPRQSCFGDPVRLATKAGSLPSIVSDETGCGSSGAPWLIEGAPGQRVNISMLDFAYTPTSSGAKASTMTCEPYGYIVERKLGINRTVCGGVARRSNVYMSASSSVEIYLKKTPARSPDTSFIIEYKVIGCPDARPPEHAWYKRAGDTAEMGCEWSDLSWQVKCIGTGWIGSMGNCSVTRVAEASEENDSMEIHPVLSMGLIIGLAALIAVLLFIIGFGFYCMKRKNSKSQTALTVADESVSNQPEQQATMHRVAYPSQPGDPCMLSTNRRAQRYIPGNREEAPNSTLLPGWGATTVKRGQHGESEYLAPCLTGSYLAEKYGAPVYDTVGTRNGTGERNSSAGDGDWVQEANFQFVTPQI